MSYESEMDLWLPARRAKLEDRRTEPPNKTKKTQPERTQTYINFNYSRESLAKENECILRSRSQYQIPYTIYRVPPILLLQVGEWRMELKFHCEYFLGALPARREKMQ